MFRADGKCSFDSVQQEADSGNSYTLIFGGQCKIESVNTTGPIAPFTQNLGDGDILFLSNAVLKTTTLSIRNTSTNPIIILTFIKSSSIVQTPKQRPPPIGMPGSLSNAKKDILLGKYNERTLFLTDSVLKSISAQSLSTRLSERCVKKVSYYFSDFMQFEPEFQYTNTIVISAGINDLCRKRMLPREICDVVIPQLRRLSTKYRQKNFVINSILHTNNRQLNNHVDRLNRFLKDGIKSLKNVFFFDSHDRNIDGRNIYTDTHGIKIHINNYAVQNVKRHLVTLLKSIAPKSAITRSITR